MTVYRYLDLSTGHVTEAESDAMSAGFPDAEDGPRTIPHEYGCWVNVQAGWDDEDKQAFAAHYPNVGAVIEIARLMDCVWINFDRDGNRLPGLPTYEW